MLGSKGKGRSGIVSARSHPPAGRDRAEGEGEIEMTGRQSSKSAMRGFDSLPADVRAALHEVSMPVSKAQRLVKLYPANAAAMDHGEAP